MAMQTLAPMAPYANKLLMVRGIRAMNEWSFGGTLGQTTDPTLRGHRLVLHVPTRDALGERQIIATPTGRSLDHICAEQVNPSGGGPLFMQIGGVNGSVTNTQSTISFDKPNQIFPGVGSPTQIYNNLTNLFGEGAMYAGHVSGRAWQERPSTSFETI